MVWFAPRPAYLMTLQSPTAHDLLAVQAVSLELPTHTSCLHLQFILRWVTTLLFVSLRISLFLHSACLHAAGHVAPLVTDNLLSRCQVYHSTLELPSSR